MLSVESIRYRVARLKVLNFSDFGVFFLVGRRIMLNQVHLNFLILNLKLIEQYFTFQLLCNS